MQQANSEIINGDMALNEYVMLALRSNGINLSELEKKFGKSWISRNFNYIQKLEEKNLVIINNNFLHLTKSGYAICDEILSKML